MAGLPLAPTPTSPLVIMTKAFGYKISTRTPSALDTYMGLGPGD